MNIPAIVSFAIMILVTFLKGTIKNPSSPEAQKIKAILTVLRDEINDFLSVFPA